MKPAGQIAIQPWMQRSETRAVIDALAAEGAELRFVGGCVRDTLAKRQVKDIDIATPDPPETVMALLQRAGLEAVPTGLAHGTVTAISDGKPFEITTLRVDVETFGRHARVAFTDDWEADAARRDFTINAMALAPDGSLYDPFGGQADLAAGHVRFVGDPAERIREDYLRLLRFFRFHAHYGRGKPDSEGLAAATALSPHLAELSGERLRTELLRLLEAPDPVSVCRVMAARSILASVLPEATNVDALAALIEVEPAGPPPDALRRLAVLVLTDRAGANAIAARLKLSRQDWARLLALSAPQDPVTVNMETTGLRRALYREGRDRVYDLLLLDWARRKAAGDALTARALDSALAETAGWQEIRFPLQGRDAQALGLPSGPKIGELLRAVEDWWIAQDFEPDRDACLERLRTLIADSDDLGG